MKAAAFEYAKVGSVAEAVALKARHGDGARFLAGGQSLLPALNLRLDQPDLLIDINGLAELEGIVFADGKLRIGALARTAPIGRSELVARHAPLLVECVPHIAHPAIRTLGTIGGSVALADAAAEWPAACLALDAEMIVAGPAGQRAIPAAQFFLGLYQTALMTDDLLVRIDFPAAPEGARVAAVELARRRGDFAIAGLLAQAVVQAGVLSDVRTAFFGVGDRPVRLAGVEEALTGKPDVAAAQAAVGDGLDAVADLYHSQAAKVHLAKVLVARAVQNITH